MEDSPTMVRVDSPTMVRGEKPGFAMSREKVLPQSSWLCHR
nr:truncated Kidd blood group antigen [Homo sapiens]